jgi:hypothetical protein
MRAQFDFNPSTYPINYRKEGSLCVLFDVRTQERIKQVPCAYEYDAIAICKALNASSQYKDTKATQAKEAQDKTDAGRQKYSQLKAL